MSVMPGVDWRPVTQHGGAMGSVRGIVLHHIVGTLDSAETIFNRPGSNTSAHFGVGYDGAIRQWVDTSVVAYHACQANYTGWLGIEHESPSSGDLYVPLTDAQVRATGSILAWLHETAGVPLAVSDDVNVGGVAYHSMDPGECQTHWGLTGCPGAPIIAQRAAIIAAASGQPTQLEDTVYYLRCDDTKELLVVSELRVAGYPLATAPASLVAQAIPCTSAEREAEIKARNKMLADLSPKPGSGSSGAPVDPAVKAGIATAAGGLATAAAALK